MPIRPELTRGPLKKVELFEALWHMREALGEIRASGTLLVTLDWMYEGLTDQLSRLRADL